MGRNLDAVRAAVEEAKIIAGEFHTGIAKFYEDGNVVPLFELPCRFKKPKPSSFDAGNQTQWSTKKLSSIKVPQNIGVNVIRKGLIVQISTPDGDPTINFINFTVESSLSSQFSAERVINLATEVTETPRIS
jgi:hypothetical protein